jgi:hypothetical protein
MPNYKDKYTIRESGKTAPLGELRKPQLLRGFRNRLKAVNVFYVISAFFQVILGFIVTAIAILNLIKPLWLSGFMSLIGCVVAMLGLYQLYDVLKSSRSTQDLARDAIERAIRSRN